MPTTSDNTPAANCRLNDLYISICAPARPRAAVLLAHGLMLDSQMWDPITELLDDELLLIAPDHRGHGASAGNNKDLSIPAIAEDLAMITDSLVPAGLPLLVVGHSLGSMALLHAMSTGLISQPAAAVLTSSSAGELGTVVLRRMLSLLPHVAAARPGVFDAGWTLSRKALSPWAGPTARNPVRTKPSPEAVAGLLASLQNWNIAAQLNKIAGLPSTLICGQNDRITPVGHSNIIAERIGEAAAVQPIARIGHDLPVKAPQLIASAITTALSNLILSPAV